MRALIWPAIALFAGFDLGAGLEVDALVLLPLLAITMTFLFRFLLIDRFPEA